MRPSNIFVVFCADILSNRRIENSKTAAMAMTSTASRELKLLRKQAGLSVRGLASALAESGARVGRTSSSYAYYENDYKKPYLPADLVDLLVPVLAGRGTPPITERQILRLGGPARNGLWLAKLEFSHDSSTPGEAARPSHSIDSALLANVMEQIARHCAALKLDLSMSQHARLTAEVYRRVAETEDGDRSVVLDDEARHACELAKSLASA